MARNAAGLRRRSPGAASSRVEKLRGGSKAIVDYLADDALRSVVEVTSGAGEATTAYLSERGVRAMIWRGRGMAALGVEGTVAAPVKVVGVFDGRDPRVVVAARTDEEVAAAEIVAAGNRKIDGFEMSFSATKSVSALRAFGGAGVRAEIDAALGDATRAAVAVFDDACQLTRIGSAAKRSWIQTHGLLCASVLHDAARGGDPQAHVHLVIANQQLDIEGTWRAIDANEIFDSKALAALMFSKTLRASLTRRLGVDWVEPAGGGHLEMAWRSDGTEVVPPQLRERWSTRSRQIDAAAAELAEEAPGMAGGNLRQRAATTTRPDKDLSEAPEERPARWEREAEAAVPGIVAAVRGRLAAEGTGPPPAVWTSEQVTGLMVTVEASLTDRLSVWDERELLNTITEHMPDHVTWRDAQQVAGWMFERQVVRLWARGEGIADDAHRQRRPGTALYATFAAIEREVRLDEWWNAARTHRDAKRAAPAHIAAVIAAAIRAGTLDDSQAEIVRSVCGDGRAAASIVGPAGGGKTTPLKAVTATAARSGIPIGGVAVSRQASQVLAKATGMPSTSLEAALRRPDDWLPAAGWWIIDEASTVSSRDWDRLRALAEQCDAKVIAVGDPRQLGAVGAGEWWAHVVGVAAGQAADSKVPEPACSLWRLDGVRRFVHEWERAASLRLRVGDVDALDAYAAEGRLISRPGPREVVNEIATRAVAEIRAADTDEQQRTEALAIAKQKRREARKKHQAAPRSNAKRRQRLWADIERANRQLKRAEQAIADAALDARRPWDAVVVSTATRDQAEALNAAIRQQLRGDSTVPQVTYTWTEDGINKNRILGVGDLVMTRHNDHRQVTTTGGTVINGARWHIARLGTDNDGEVSLLLRSVDDGGEVVLGKDYWAPAAGGAPLIEGAWAAPVHRTQGRTVGVGLCWATRGLDCSGAYVALSRGKRANIAVGVGDVHATLVDALRTDPPRSALDAAEQGRLEREPIEQQWDLDLGL